jgi:hypothetical protein
MPITTSLAQNLGNDDKTPLPTETAPVQEPTQEPTQESVQESVQESTQEQEHRDAGILYMAEGQQKKL